MTRVAVLMGGESRERDVSRVTGTAVAKALAERGFDVMLLDTRDGLLRLDAAPVQRIGERPPGEEPGDRRPVASGESAADRTLLPGGIPGLAEVDVVFVALHGGWGEDGTVQATFEMMGIPYTGSGVLASALAMDKERAKRMMRDAGVATPAWALLDVAPGTTPADADLERVSRDLPGRLVVKPNAEGSTVGLTVVDRPEDLRAAVETAARYDRRVLIEEYVAGRELTVAVLGGETLPIVEIVPQGGIYTYEAKYTQGKSRYEVPAALPDELTAAVRRASRRVFDLLGCEGYARVDWRLREDGTFLCLEVNTVPGMTPLSLVPMAARAAGIEFGELLERIVRLGEGRTLRRPRRRAAGAGA
ncbi:MAG: D-alanine--D-alanine ligase [bacterium]